MPQTSSHEQILAKIEALYQEVFAHDGHGEIRIEMRILRRGQKEIIVHCGKQYRFVVDYKSHPDTASGAATGGGRDPGPSSGRSA